MPFWENFELTPETSPKFIAVFVLSDLAPQFTGKYETDRDNPVNKDWLWWVRSHYHFHMWEELIKHTNGVINVRPPIAEDRFWTIYVGFDTLPDQETVNVWEDLIKTKFQNRYNKYLEMKNREEIKNGY